MASFAAIGILASLLIPAIQEARESARATTCLSRVRQLALALRAYEETYRRLPPGARSAPYNTMGVSWLVELLPQIEHQAIFDAYERDTLHSGWPSLQPRNRKLIDGLTLSVLRCPSSDLPSFNDVGGSAASVLTPSYVGIAGAASDADFPELRVSACCYPKMDGALSAGGVLSPNTSVSLSSVTDGLSNTMCVSETSTTALTAAGRERRIDAGLVPGWVGGASSAGVPPHSGPAYVWNITTIAHGINRREFELSGVFDNRGANNPLVSPHPDVVHAAFLDGSAKRLGEKTPLLLLKAFATRDDGSAIRGNR